MFGVEDALFFFFPLLTGHPFMNLLIIALVFCKFSFASG